MSSQFDFLVRTNKTRDWRINAHSTHMTVLCEIVVIKSAIKILTSVGNISRYQCVRMPRCILLLALSSCVCPQPVWTLQGGIKPFEKRNTPIRRIDQSERRLGDRLFDRRLHELIAFLRKKTDRDP